MLWLITWHKFKTPTCNRRKVLYSRQIKYECIKCQTRYYFHFVRENIQKLQFLYYFIFDNSIQSFECWKYKIRLYIHFQILFLRPHWCLILFKSVVFAFIYVTILFLFCSIFENKKEHQWLYCIVVSFYIRLMQKSNKILVGIFYQVRFKHKNIMKGNVEGLWMTLKKPQWYSLSTD